MFKTALLQKARIRGHTFIPAPISQSSIVFDLGAHKGEFSRQMTTLFGCRCIAVEANPKLATAIEQIPNAQVICGAACGTDGQGKFNLSDNPEASTLAAHSREANGSTVDVPIYSLKTLMQRASVSRIDLLKVDIEGAEIDFLLTTPANILSLADQISVEFHDFCGHITTKDIAAVQSRMKVLRYEAFSFGYHEFQNVDWLFVRRGALDNWRVWYLKYLIQPIHRFRY
jgi:FkbM family methyltransferase